MFWTSLMRFARVTAAMLGAAVIATSALAQDVGVPSCDSFLKTFETCVAAKAAPEQKGQMKTIADQVKKNWLDVAKTDEGKKQLDAVCKQTAEQIKSQVASLGCTW